MLKRRVLKVVLIGLTVLLAPAIGRAEDYPARPIRLIITTPAGSLVDVLGRLYAQDLAERLGQPVVVDIVMAKPTPCAAFAISGIIGVMS